jgi:L-fuconolactonase
MLRVDSHMHLFAALTEEFPRGVAPLYPAERHALAEEYLARIQTSGIDHAVLVSLDEYDDYAALAKANYPDRFSVVAVMNQNAPDAILDFRNRFEKMPLLGYRIWELGDPSSELKKLKFFPLLQEMNDRGVIAWFYSNAEQIRLLPRVLEELPNLQVILNHLGFCQSGFMVDSGGRPRIDSEIPPTHWPVVQELAKNPNVSVHFSGQYAFTGDAYPYLDLQPIGDSLVNAFGPDRLLWGSDWPWIKTNPSYEACFALVDHHFPGLSTYERDLIRGGNAARIFKL